MHTPYQPPTALVFLPCHVCRGISVGKWYGGFVCRNCAAFFKRSVRRKREFKCKAPKPDSCPINRQCCACRLKRCINAGLKESEITKPQEPDLIPRRNTKPTSHVTINESLSHPEPPMNSPSQPQPTSQATSEGGLNHLEPPVNSLTQPPPIFQTISEVDLNYPEPPVNSSIQPQPIFQTTSEDGLNHPEPPVHPSTQPQLVSQTTSEDGLNHPEAPMHPSTQLQLVSQTISAGGPNYPEPPVNSSTQPQLVSQMTSEVDLNYPEPPVNSSMQPQPIFQTTSEVGLNHPEPPVHSSIQPQLISQTTSEGGLNHPEPPVNSSTLPPPICHTTSDYPESPVNSSMQPQPICQTTYEDGLIHPEPTVNSSTQPQLVSQMTSEGDLNHPEPPVNSSIQPQPISQTTSESGVNNTEPTVNSPAKPQYSSQTSCEGCHNPSIQNQRTPRFNPPPHVLADMKQLEEVLGSQLVKNSIYMQIMLFGAGLDMTDQLDLVDDGWKNLLIISLARSHIPIHLSHRIFHYGDIHPNCTKLGQFMDETYKLRAVIVQLRTLKLKEIEYRALQLITLFKSSDTSNVYALLQRSKNDWFDTKMYSSKIAKLKLITTLLRTESALASYMTCTYPYQRSRYAAIMNVLDLMQGISKSTIVELFLNKQFKDSLDVSKSLLVLHQHLPNPVFEHFRDFVSARVGSALPDEIKSGDIEPQLENFTINSNKCTNCKGCFFKPSTSSSANDMNTGNGCDNSNGHNISEEDNSAKSVNSVDPDNIDSSSSNTNNIRGKGNNRPKISANNRGRNRVNNRARKRAGK